MNTIDEAIAILQAMKEGKKIQYRSSDGLWADRELCLLPDFVAFTYRIKPVPKEIWVNEYEDLLCWAIHSDELSARSDAAGDVIRRAVHYREVIE